MQASKLGGDFESCGSGRGVAIGTGAAIGVAGIHDDAAHFGARFLQVSLGDYDRGGLDAIHREDGSGGGWNLTDEKREIEAGLLESAPGGGEREAARNIGSGRPCTHAETGVAESERIGSVTPSGITVAITATSLHERRLEHVRQSRSSFSVSD